jgi:hypothetical protein
MSDTKKEIVNKSQISGAMGYYENAMIITKGGTDETDHFFINYDEFAKVAKLFDFEIEKKRTRSWGKPIINPIFDFVEFREFLLYNEKCTTEEMELILRFLGEYYERKKGGETFIDE